ncbi:MAG: hypothetical protein ABJL67_04790 [Sulfitobacter sp.]
MRSLFLFLVLFGATPCWSDTKEALIRSIEDAGTNDYQDERHSVEIDGCQITTYRWRDRPDHGWVLWSSFQFDMVDAVLTANKGKSKERYLYARLEAGPPEIGFAIIPFKMQEGTFARFERTVLRPSTELTRPSPRNDGKSHYFQKSDDFFIGHEGPDVAQKATAFTQGFTRYVAEFCTFSS